jgi:hypothetical protein
MENTISQWLAGVPAESQRIAFRRVLGAIGDRLSSQTLTSAALRIKGGSASAVVQSNAVYVGCASGVLVTKATTTDMAALVGTVVNATFNVFAHFIDKAGTLTTAMGLPGATLAAVKLPPIPEGKALIGFVIINPTGTGNFVGGTTALDDATVVPNAVFVNTVGAFDPTVLV